MAISAANPNDAFPVFSGVKLEHAFATEFPELAMEWQASAAPNPSVAVLNEGLAASLGLDPSRLDTERGAKFLAGLELATGSTPVAQLYAGHQFGGYSPMLGDGRALLLGEIVTPSGELVDLHLKGSGRTPPARGDGFAALGPMLREYLVSESMHALGVPTTRSLAVVMTGRTVRRDDFMHDNMLPGAVLARVATSHVRVGTFQLAHSMNNPELLGRLVDFSIRRHYPNLEADEQPALGLFREVVHSQAKLVAKWMLVGFVHGVMNTDNVTISGETIDYGPCAFIDAYDPAAVFSSIDSGGRYAFGAQPTIAKWNLARFAESLLPLLTETDGSIAEAVGLVEPVLGEFDDVFSRTWTNGMAAKLGIRGASDEAVRDLAEEFLQILARGRVDYTTAFRRLTDVASNANSDENTEALSLFSERSGDRDSAAAWLTRWMQHAPSAALMQSANPVTIPRNHLLAEALEAATNGDLAPFEEMLAAATHPFEERPEWARFAKPAPADSVRFISTCGT